MQINGLAPAQNGMIFSLFEAFDAKTGRVNISDTNALVYTNTALASGKNITGSGMYFTA